ncbi:glycosyltransferase family 2 protein [Halorubrum sp. AJ67]|uniref:glycosyltransferase family 2 protein n=1 Tax=Halorubrum sp. AJ67 TaxID=1173487 RepID=UPI0003DCD01F|nr:glycosyltransferase family 2 protein [Halorubrum sp. AJ67]CDK39327.1 glycosyl transferase family 2 protein [Halorubrum sp. AJ67]
MEPKVSIVLLNWNNFDDTDDCLESIEKQDYGQLQTILIDNGSDDGSFGRLTKDHNLVSTRLKSNIGFPAANNIGIEIAMETDSDYIFLLNNDTILPKDDVISKLVSVAEGRENLGILSPIITHYPETEQIWFAKGVINKYLGETKHKYKNRNIGELDSKRLINNDRMTGCAMFVPDYVFEDVGKLESDYFLLESDTDFSLRVREQGYDLITDSTNVIHHKVSASTDDQFELSYYSSRNRWRLINDSSTFYRTAKLAYVLGTIRGIFRRIKSGEIRYVPDLVRGAIHGIIGRDGKK